MLAVLLPVHEQAFLFSRLREWFPARVGVTRIEDIVSRRPLSNNDARDRTPPLCRA